MVNNNNVQNIKFLRNGVVFVPSNDPVKTARQVALDAMEGQKENLADGTAILGRYQETNGDVKTLVGFAYISGNTKTLTVFDVDGASANVNEKILSAIQTLDAEKTSTDGKNVQVNVTEVDGKITAVNITTDNTVNSGDVASAIKTEIDKLDYTGVTTGDGVYVTNVTEADGVIAATTATLPSLPEVKENGKPIVAVSEDKGKVAASAGNINAEYVDVSYSAITATNVKGALAEIADEIDGMDLDVVSGDGEVITAVSEKDGKVSASKTAIKDVKLTGYVKSTTATGAISGNDDIEDALSKLENKAAAITINDADHSINVTPTVSGTDISVNIKSGEKVIKLDGEGGGIYTDIKIASATPSSTTVKEEYNLLDSDGNALGASIKIYKDSSIVEIYLGTSGDSVNTETGVITKLDGDKQYLNYVYVNADGKYEMTKINISVFITEQEFASGVTFDSTENKVKGVVDSTSEQFLTVGANGFKLSGVQDAINGAINALDVTGDAAVAGQYVAAIEQTNGVVAVKTRANVSEAVLNNYDKGSDSGAVASTDTINQAISKLENQIASKVDALDATVSGETTDGKVNVKVTETNGVITAVNVVGTDIASASALTAEIAARKAVDGQDGQTYVANSGKKFISGATSLNGADVALNDALENVDSKYVSGVTVNGKAVTVSNHVAPISISATNGTGASATPIVINTDNNTGAVTIQLEGLDCGTY